MLRLRQHHCNTFQRGPLRAAHHFNAFCKHAQPCLLAHTNRGILCTAAGLVSSDALQICLSCVNAPGCPSPVRGCAGTSLFVLHQGMSFGDLDLPAGSSKQPSMEACAAGCLNYTGTSPCVAWTSSSDEDGSPGTCQLKAAVGPVHLTEQSVVSGHVTGEGHRHPGTGPLAWHAVGRV